MADVFDKETKKLLKSVNTPDYLNDRYIINPPFIPDCEPKYIVVEVDNTIREMTDLEKNVVDYVSPPPEPTAEEIAAQAEAERDTNIISEIDNVYSRTDEIGIIRESLIKLLPYDADVAAWNNVVLEAKAKYPKV